MKNQSLSQIKFCFPPIQVTYIYHQPNSGVLRNGMSQQQGFAYNSHFTSKG